MGKPIVYCGGCGENIREEDFEKGKAHLLEGQPFCTRCRPLPAGTSPPPRKPPSTKIPAPSSPPRKTTTAHVPLARPPTRRTARGAGPRTLLAVAGGLGAFFLLILVAAVASNGRSGTPPKKDRAAEPPPVLQSPGPSAERPDPPPERRAVPLPPSKTNLPPEEILRQLEAFAASSTDPDAVLQKCDEAAAALRGKPQATRLREIEARASERKKTIDSDRQVAISIEEARKLQASDPKFERKEEILKLLRSASGIAGPRKDEVDRLIADYEAALRAAEAAAARKEESPPPPAPPELPAIEVTSFTLIDADSDQPIPRYDPIPNGAVLNLAALPTRNLNIRANTKPEKVGSVRFKLDSVPAKQLEKELPYALAGSIGPNYQPWTPPLGPHTLTATPYANSSGSGTFGKALTISFTVIDSPGEKILYAEDFEKGPGKFKGGSVVDGGREGSRALSVPPGGATIEDIPFTPVRPSTRLRFRAKPTADLPCLEVVSWSPKLKVNYRTRARDLRQGEWTLVELRLADAHTEYDGSGPSMEGVTPSNVKLYFDEALSDARVLIDDFELIE